MSLSILNNIPSLEAQNQLATTNMNLQNTLFQLSSGSKINSGADDPAGLSIADGLQANISALTQSTQNVTDGVGMLQTADGALSQVTTLLNRAVTLATEAGNAGLTPDQQNALQGEYASITQEINQIGSNTTYNNNQVFTSQLTSVFLSDGSQTDSADPTISVTIPQLSATALGLSSYATGTLDLTTNPNAGNTVQIGQQTYTFVASGSANAANQVALGQNVQGTLDNLQSAVNGTGTASPGTYGVGTAANQSAQITTVNGGSAVVQALAAGLGGNSVQLSTNLTANSGMSGADLTNGANTTYDAGTLSLNAQPGVLSTATGSVGLSAMPDTIATATGAINLVKPDGTTALNPTAYATASGTITLSTTQPVTGNAISTLTLGSTQPAVLTAATATLDLGTTTPLKTGSSYGTLTMTGDAAPNDGDVVNVGGTAYTFVTALTENPGAKNNVLINGSAANALTNLEHAVNGGGTVGTDYSYGTTQAGNVVVSSVNTTAGTALFSTTSGWGSQGAVAMSYTPSGSATGVFGGLTSGATGNLKWDNTAANTVKVGSDTYTFVAANAATTGNEIAVGNPGLTTATLQNAATLANLQSALANGSTGETAATYHSGTAGANAFATIQGVLGGATSATLTATTGGAAANGNGSYATTITGGNTTSAMAGGLNADKITVGNQTYTFVAAGAANAANEVALGVDAGVTGVTETLTHLMDAIDATTTSNGAGGGSTSTFGVGTGLQTGATGAMVTPAGLTGGSTNSLQVQALGAGVNAGLVSAAGSTISGDIANNYAGAASADTVSIGNVTYTFVAAGMANAANEVALGADAGAAGVQETLDNLKAAVNSTSTAAYNATTNPTGGSATTFGVGTTLNTQAYVTSDASEVLNVIAKTTGAGVNGGSAATDTGNYTKFSGTGSLANIPQGNGGGTGTLLGGVAGDSLKVGAQTYTFVAAGDATQANYVAIGGTSGDNVASDVLTTLTNLMNAVNGNDSTAAGVSTFGVGTRAAGTASMSLGATDTQANITATTPGLGDATTGNGVALQAYGTIANDVGPTGKLTGGQNADTMTIGNQTYTFVANNQATNANQVSVGTSITQALQNLEAAVNTTGTGGTTGTYGVGTVKQTGAGAATITGINTTSNTLTVEAGAQGVAAPGAAGNQVQLGAYSQTNTATTSGAFLTGGASADTVTVGNVTYTFVAAGQAQSGGGANEVALGVASGSGSTAISAQQATLNNLMAAVNSTAVANGSANTYQLKDATQLQGTTGATITSDANGMAQVLAQTAGGIGLTANFAAGDTTGAVGGLTAQTLNGGSTAAGTSASGMIDLAAGQPTVGNATGTVSFNVGNDINNLAGTTVTIGNGGTSATYKFVTTLTGGGHNANDVLIGTSMTTALQNLQDAVNGGGAAGAVNTDNYFTGTTTAANAGTAAVISSINATTGTVTFAAQALGSQGSSIDLAATGAGTASGPSLSGGGTSDTLTVGAVTYTFVAANTAGFNPNANEIALGNASGSGPTAVSAVQQTLTNLQAALNATAGNYNANTGTLLGAATFNLNDGNADSIQGQSSNLGATITAINGSQAVVTAATSGDGGNTLALSDTFANTANVAGSPGGYAGASQAQGTFDLNVNPSSGNTVTIGQQTYTFVTTTPTAADQVLVGADPNGTLKNLAAAVNGGLGSGTLYGAKTSANTSATMTVNGAQATITAIATGTSGNGVALSSNLSNGSTGGAVGTANSALAGGGNSVDLSNATDAQEALTVIAGAISSVAATRGAIGSSINQMNAAVQVMNNTTQNLTSSLSGIQDANIGQVVANMSKYQVLEQTGISALTQANQQEQTVLKLLQ